MLDTIRTYTYHDTLALISYHGDFTDTSIHNLRYAVYGPFADPQLFIDRMRITTIDSATCESSINAARNITPSLNLFLDAQGTSGNGSVTLKIVNVDSLLDLDSVYAFVGVCQDSVDGILKDFNYVCRFLFYFPISVPYADSIDTTITFTNSYPVGYLHAVAFIQNLKNSSSQHLKVYQAVTVPFINLQQ